MTHGKLIVSSSHRSATRAGHPSPSTRSRRFERPRRSARISAPIVPRSGRIGRVQTISSLDWAQRDLDPRAMEAAAAPRSSPSPARATRSPPIATSPWSCKRWRIPMSKNRGQNLAEEGWRGLFVSGEAPSAVHAAHGRASATVRRTGAERTVRPTRWVLSPVLSEHANENGPQGPSG